jgi:hypothetical protein
MVYVYLQLKPILKKIRSVLTKSELRHNSKDGLFTLCEKVVTELWLSYDWPNFFKNRLQL